MQARMRQNHKPREARGGGFMERKASHGYPRRDPLLLP